MRASQRAPKSVRSSPVAPLSAAAHTHHTYRTAHHEPPARTQDKKTTQDEAPGPKYSLTDGFGVQARWPAATHDATAKPQLPLTHRRRPTRRRPTRRRPTRRSNRTFPADGRASLARASAKPPRGSWCACAANYP